jgi:hypothetical protein
MRLITVIVASAPHGKTWLESDTSWRWGWVPVWAQIEVDVSIVAASLPSLSLLIKKVWYGFSARTMRTPSHPFPVVELVEPADWTSPTLRIPSTASAKDQTDKNRRSISKTLASSEEVIDIESYPSTVAFVGIAETAETVDARTVVHPLARGSTEGD